METPLSDDDRDILAGSCLVDQVLAVGDGKHHQAATYQSRELGGVSNLSAGDHDQTLSGDSSRQCSKGPRGRSQGRGCQPVQEISVTLSTSVATGAVGSVTSTTVMLPSGQKPKM
jgi:hypothetical protein